ncbi:MAG: redoxin family protein [Bdellovibrionales bacterium]
MGKEKNVFLLKLLVNKQMRFFCALLFLFANPSSVEAKNVGETFPLVKIKNLAGTEETSFIDLLKTHDLTIVDFWASWCGPCTEAMPFLDQLHSKLKDKKVQVLGVNVDDKSTDPDVKELASKVKFPLLFDEGKKLSQEAGVVTMPTTYILDKKGTILHVHQGFRKGDEKKLEKQVQKLLPKNK